MDVATVQKNQLMVRAGRPTGALQISTNHIAERFT